jgi:3-oxoacyl-[acyl-carrier protein] reductase
MTRISPSLRSTRRYCLTTMPTVTTTITSTAAEGTTTATTTVTAPEPAAEEGVPSHANNSIKGASARVVPGKIFLDTPGDTVDLKGKVALITGASRGIGQAIAENLAAKGMKVVLTARSVGDLAKICDDIKAKGGEAAHIKYDCESTAEAKAAFEFAEATFGPVYLVCANSGFADLKEMDDITEDDVDRIFAVNQKAPFMAFSLARSHFKKNGGGCWVVTSSLAASLQREQFAGAPASMALYSSGKAAVVDMARAFGVKYADENVRAYAICPAVYTPAVAIAAPGTVPWGP